MYRRKYLFLAALAPCFLLGACKPKPAEEPTEAVEEQTKSEVPSGPQTYRLPVYDYADTATVAGRVCRYVIHRQPDTTLARVKDEFGDTHFDNVYTLRITTGGKEFFSHQFTKASLEAHLTPEFRRNGLLDGMRFVEANGRTMVFSLSVSYPESDYTRTLLLKVNQDGQMHIEVDTTPDLDLQDSDIP